VISEEQKQLFRMMFMEALHEVSVEIHYMLDFYDHKPLGSRRHTCPPRVGEYERMDGSLYKVVRVIWEQGTRGERIANVYMDLINEEGLIR
jgi:hypothetical protein